MLHIIFVIIGTDIQFEHIKSAADWSKPRGGGGHLLCGPYCGCAANKGHFLSPDCVFLAKIP